MTTWDQDFVDEEEEGYIAFQEENQGEFHCGYVHGHLNCRLTTRGGETAVEWTWDRAGMSRPTGPQALVEPAGAPTSSRPRAPTLSAPAAPPAASSSASAWATATPRR